MKLGSVRRNQTTVTAYLDYKDVEAALKKYAQNEAINAGHMDGQVSHTTEIRVSQSRQGSLNDVVGAEAIVTITINHEE